jgi:hypothetical protein
MATQLAREPFRRPSGRFIGHFTRHLPPAPSPQPRLYTSWRHIRQHTHAGLVLAAISMLAAVFAAIRLLYVEIPALRISPVSLVAGCVYMVIHNDYHWVHLIPTVVSTGGSSGSSPLWLSIPFTVGILILLRFFLRIFPEAALSEEQTFRQGCESWTTRERTRACLLFGFAHIFNLIYPLATLVALSVGGGLFMWSYQREFRRSGSSERATMQATALHALYNGLAATGVAVYLIYITWP